MPDYQNEDERPVAPRPVRPGRGQVLLLAGTLLFTGCGLSSLAVIPTLFAKRSRLQGCPETVAQVNEVVELTFVLVNDDETTTMIDDDMAWSMSRGEADIDDSMNNPVTVTLTTPGIITVRSDYHPPDENINPATCSIFVQAPAE